MSLNYQTEQSACICSEVESLVLLQYLARETTYVSSKGIFIEYEGHQKPYERQTYKLYGEYYRQ